MSSLFDFTGRRVLVTGGGRGIGLAIVKKFMEHNATVIVLEKNESLLQNLKEALPSVIGIEVDLSCWDATTVAVQSALPIHHLVNNAGICHPVPFLELTEKDIDITFDVNFKSYVHVAQVVAQDMLKNKVEDGTIVNISSAADQRSFTPDIPLEIYSCSKGAVSTLTRVLAAEFSSARIRVNSIRPGPVSTDMARETLAQDAGKVKGPSSVEGLIERLIHKRFLQGSEIAEAVLFLSSKMSGMITGSSLAVDGGMDLL